MSCSNCKQVIDPELPWAEFHYNPQKRITKKSLVKSPGRPRGGWTVVVPVKGSLQSVEGVGPGDVAHKVKKLFKVNNHNVDENTLWYNLNVQWLERTADKYQVISLAELLSYSEPQEISSDDKHASQKVDPRTWAEGFFTFLKAYSDSDTYSWDVFVGFLNQFHKMLNPSENALLGNSNWYLRFTISLDKLKKNPAYQGEQARIWLNGIQI